MRPSAGGRSRRKSHKPNNKLRPERTQHRFNNQENDSISADNVIASPSYSDAPIQLQSEQKRISRHDEALFIESQAIQQQRRPSHRPHDQRRCSRKSEVKQCLHILTNHQLFYRTNLKFNKFHISFLPNGCGMIRKNSRLI